MFQAMLDWAHDKGHEGAAFTLRVTMKDGTVHKSTVLDYGEGWVALAVLTNKGDASPATIPSRLYINQDHAATAQVVWLD